MDTVSIQTPKYKLNDKWNLYYHLPDNKQWDIASYNTILGDIQNAEEVIALNKQIPEQVISRCMLFLMRKGITPMWEDPKNKNGGCFSYKINHHIQNIWRDVSYSLIGKTLSTDAAFQKDITGISISPKKNFCILKVWMGSCVHRDPSKITLIKPEGCIFKKH
jgi:hypothetical protein